MKFAWRKKKICCNLLEVFCILLPYLAFIELHSFETPCLPPPLALTGPGHQGRGRLWLLQKVPAQPFHQLQVLHVLLVAVVGVRLGLIRNFERWRLPQGGRGEPFLPLWREVPNFFCLKC